MRDWARAARRDGRTHGVLDARRGEQRQIAAPALGREQLLLRAEAWRHGVRVSKQVECEACGVRQLAGIDGTVKSMDLLMPIGYGPSPPQKSPQKEPRCPFDP